MTTGSAAVSATAACRSDRSDRLRTEVHDQIGECASNVLISVDSDQPHQLLCTRFGRHHGGKVVEDSSLISAVIDGTGRAFDQERPSAGHLQQSREPLFFVKAVRRHRPHPQGCLVVSPQGDRTHRRIRIAGCEYMSYDWQPLEPYPGARTPWRCQCLRCGTVATPRFHGQSKSRGCSGCSGRVGRISEASAIAVMREAGWIPTVPYPGPRAVWPSACEVCGRLSGPRYEAVKSSKSGCRTCAAARISEERRHRFEPVAVAKMRVAGLEPLETYPGAQKPWRCRCTRCDQITYPTYGNVSSTRSSTLPRKSRPSDNPSRVLKTDATTRELLLPALRQRPSHDVHMLAL